jgi:drug/metabolite transporter (DMT)-like permease
VNYSCLFVLYSYTMWNQWSEPATAVGPRLASVCVVAERYRGGLLFGIVALVMGAGYVAIGVGTETVPPTLLAAFRFDASASVLLTYAFLTRRWRPQTTADVLAIVVLGELVLAGTVGFLFAGQRYTTASIAAVAMGLGPIVTVPLAYLLVPGEHISRADLVGVVLGFCGVAIVANPSPAEATNGSEVGIALVCCAVLSSLETDLSLLSLTGWGALLGGATLHLVSAGLGETGGPIAWTPASIVALIYLGIGVGIGGYAALLSLLAEVGPTRASLTSFASPVVAIIAGWLVLGEAVTAFTLGGFLVVTAGFVVLNRADLGSVLETIRR